MTVRMILRRKIVIQRKSQYSVVDIRLLQPAVFKVCFHVEVETGFVASSKRLNL